MKCIAHLRSLFSSGVYDQELAQLYGQRDCGIFFGRERFVRLLNHFEERFGTRPVRLFSAPGRVELCGNHTDHNHGKVLAASVNLDMIAAISPNDEPVIRVKSEGFDKTDCVRIDELDQREDERQHSAALIRGIVRRFHDLGYNVGGFDAYTMSDVPSGSGISSSAAFEVLICEIINRVFNEGAITPVQIAQIAQYAENEYFGKPCGLMDQLTIAVGGCIAMDFNDPCTPSIHKLMYDFDESAHTLFICATGGSHTDLTADYAQIPQEMKDVAGFFGAQVLRELAPEQIWARVTDIRKACGDRAFFRAVHFFEENRRVDRAISALVTGDFYRFKRILIESGRSSAMYLQNVSPWDDPRSQNVAAALIATMHILSGKGCWRVHGGGFAGTILAFVPENMTKQYVETMESLLGEGKCLQVGIRKVGPVELCAEVAHL